MPRKHRSALRRLCCSWRAICARVGGHFIALVVREVELLLLSHFKKAEAISDGMNGLKMYDVQGRESSFNDAGSGSGEVNWVGWVVLSSRTSRETKDPDEMQAIMVIY